jgi:hypothetical protein
MTPKNNIHHWLLMTWLISIVVGLSLSPVLMSIGTIGLTLQWLVDIARNQIKPWAFITFSATRNWVILYLLLMIGMLWSSNWNFGLNDLRIKLPLLLLSLTLPAYLTDLKKEKRRIVEWSFILGIVISAVVSILLVHNAMPLAHWVVSKKLSPSQIREYSVFPHMCAWGSSVHWVSLYFGLIPFTNGGKPLSVLVFRFFSFIIWS